MNQTSDRARYLIRKYGGRNPGAPDAPAAGGSVRVPQTPSYPPKPTYAVEQPTEPQRAFSTQKVRAGGRQHEIMLDVRRKTGDRIGLPYTYLTAVTFDPSEGLTLQFSTHTVRIKGRSLQKLYQPLLLHQVSYVQETRVGASRPGDETVIDGSDVEESL